MIQFKTNAAGEGVTGRAAKAMGGAAMAITAALFLAAGVARAESGSWVGNGDDGSDLEGAVPLTNEKILTARQRSLELLDRLGVGAVQGLGSLRPEIERSTLYLSQRDSQAKLDTDQSRSHSDLAGRVFARTLATPHAPTRFFPAAERLDEPQLVALHIHEGLHRALPAEIRENESAVSELTLAIVTPESSGDAVRVTAAKWIQAPEKAPSPAKAVAVGENESRAAPPESRAAKPSTFGYELRQYFRGNGTESPGYEMRRMHALQSFLYPFGGGSEVFGLGIEAALFERPASTLIGPLGLSARVRLWSGRGFDVGLWGSASLNMLSAEELKNSPFGRDVYTVGIELRKDLKFFHIENTIGYSAPGSADVQLGRVAYTYSYGSVVQAAVRAGFTLGPVLLGGATEIYLATNYRVNGGAFEGFETGRYRMVSAGPEATLNVGDFSLRAYGRVLLSAPQDVEFDSLGNLMGAGAGQANIGTRLSYRF